DAPTGDTVRLGCPADRDGSVPHPLEPGERNVASAVIDDVLVDLVGHCDRVPFSTECRDVLELFLREYLPGRIVRRVDDDRLRSVVERGFELGGVVAPVGLPKADEARSRAA